MNPIALLLFLSYLPMIDRGYSHTDALCYSVSLVATQLILIVNILLLWCLFSIFGSGIKEIVPESGEIFFVFELIVILLIIYTSIFMGGKFEARKIYAQSNYKIGDAGAWISILSFLVLGVALMMTTLVVSFK